MSSPAPPRRAALDAALERMSEGYRPEPPPEPTGWTWAARIAAVAVPVLVVVGLWVGGAIYHARFGRPSDADLVAAVERRDADRVANLLGRGANPDADTFGQALFGYDGDHALRLATANGDATTVRLLLQAGADPNRKANVGGVPLDYARANSQEEALLLLYGADRTLVGTAPRWGPYGATGAAVVTAAPAGGWPAPRMPLRGEPTREQPWEAARTGDLFTLTTMLDGGTDPNATGPKRSFVEDKTLLRSAIEGGQPAAVDLLIERGADVPAEALARALGGVGATFISDGVVPPDADFARDREIVESLIEAGVEYPAGEIGFNDPLWVAARSGDRELVDLLLPIHPRPPAGPGGPPRVLPAEHAGPLYRAAGGFWLHDGEPYAATIGETNVLEGLLAAGLDPNAGGGRSAYSPLVAAVRRGDPAAVRALLDAGADPDRPDPDTGRVPLCFVTSRKSREIAALLLDAGADPDGAPGATDPPPEDTPVTYLVRAATGLDRAALEELRAAGARVDGYTVRGGLTPLMCAAVGRPEGYEAIRFDDETGEFVPVGGPSAAGTEWLLDAGADPNAAPAGSGETALSLLARRADDDRDAAAIRRLLRAGADPTGGLGPAAGGPLAAARAGGFAAAVVLLEEAAAAEEAMRPPGSKASAAVRRELDRALRAAAAWRAAPAETRGPAPLADLARLMAALRPDPEFLPDADLDRRRSVRDEFAQLVRDDGADPAPLRDLPPEVTDPVLGELLLFARPDPQRVPPLPALLDAGLAPADPALRADLAAWLRETGRPAADRPFP